MNGKKRWQIAVIFSILIHFIILIIFAWHINSWLLTAKPAVTSEDTPVFIDDSDFSDDDNEEDVDDTADEETEAAPVQPDSDVVMPSDKTVPSSSETSAEDAVPEPDPHPKQHARAYNNLNTDTRGLNLVEIQKEYPTIPRPIFTKEFEPPESLQASPHQIRVEVKYQIQPDGSVHAGIKTSSGEEDVDQAAIDAISEWKYLPSDRPYPLTQYITINWPKPQPQQ